MQTEEIKAVARSLSKLCELQPPIDVEKSIEEIAQKIKGAVYFLLPEDTFDQQTINVLKELISETDIQTMKSKSDADYKAAADKLLEYGIGVSNEVAPENGDKKQTEETPEELTPTDSDEAQKEQSDVTPKEIVTEGVEAESKSKETQQEDSDGKKRVSKELVEEITAEMDECESLKELKEMVKTREELKPLRSYLTRFKTREGLEKAIFRTLEDDKEKQKRKNKSTKFKKNTKTKTRIFAKIFLEANPLNSSEYIEEMLKRKATGSRHSAKDTVARCIRLLKELELAVEDENGRVVKNY